MRALLAKELDPDDGSPEAKGQCFLKLLFEYAQNGGVKRPQS